MSCSTWACPRLSSRRPQRALLSGQQRRPPRPPAEARPKTRRARQHLAPAAAPLWSRRRRRPTTERTPDQRPLLARCHRRPMRISPRRRPLMPRQNHHARRQRRPRRRGSRTVYRQKPRTVSPARSHFACHPHSSASNSAPALAPLTTANMARAAADLTALLLALSIRPFVLLAGPPGCGKSTLVRAAAKLLGLEERGAFHDVSVQPHWRRHENLPREVRDALVRATGLTMCLLDEVNLAPAESYLMPLFRRHDIDQRGETALLCGTLNIDDASRPPSPKVVDRAFFLALDAPSDARIRPSPLGLVEAGALGALPTLIETPPASPGRPFEVVQQMQAHVPGQSSAPGSQPIAARRDGPGAPRRHVRRLRHQ
jgi:energy-coupling factor transporter ATP-binding protein EcfA2